jgi:hypothetical protein
MKAIERLNDALDNGASKQIFDHVRNFLMGAFILATGTTEFRQQGNQFFEIMWLGRITTLFPPREKYPGSSRLAAVPVSPSEHVLCARKFWLND